jgi:hypothetical protein
MAAFRVTYAVVRNPALGRKGNWEPFRGQVSVYVHRLSLFMVVARRRSIPPDSVQEDDQKVQNRFAACDEKCYIHRHRQKTPD